MGIPMHVHRISLRLPPVDPELFPLLQLQGCMSDADDSRNGPRYCAQDRVSHNLYEVRCCRLPLDRTSSSPHSTHDDDACVRRQQARIDALMNAASWLNDPKASHTSSSRCVVLPTDVYMQELSVTGETYVACVEPFMGLSLGDWVRSGWPTLEERVFCDILAAVDRYAAVCARLPWHGNISADAIRQRVRIFGDGADPHESASSWVITDWLLCPRQVGSEGKESAAPEMGGAAECVATLSYTSSSRSSSSSSSSSFFNPRSSAVRRRRRRRHRRRRTSNPIR